MAKSIILRSVAVCLLAGNFVSAGCNADNCLRALFPTQSPSVYSSDAAFCASFTASVDTRTTGYPSKASAACGTAASRYSSACSCKPTISSTLTSTTTSSTSKTTSTTSSTTSSTSTKTSSTSSTTSSTTSTTLNPSCTPYSDYDYNQRVRNGNFECGLAPWVAQDISGTAHKVSSPGDNSDFAYEFDQVGPVSDDSYQHPASVNQDVGTFANVPYNLSFRTYFDKCTGSEGFVGVMINHKPVYTVDACDFGAGAFKDNLVQFTGTGSDNIRFEFIIGENPAVVKIDNVKAIPLH